MVLRAERWDAGDVVLMQYAREGVVHAAVPVTIVEDTPALVATFLCAGTPVARRLNTRGYGALWEGTHVLALDYPGASHSTWAMWRADTWEFICWYINLQAPLIRTQSGFLTRDYVLDVVIYADGRWRWKDEDEVEAAIVAGKLTREIANAARAEGERVLAGWREGQPPFCEPWPTWRPDEMPAPPELPDDWDTIRPLAARRVVSLGRHPGASAIYRHHTRTLGPSNRVE